MKIRGQANFGAGLLFTGLGGAIVAMASQYSIGSAATMGPGYFPIMLGIVLVVLGVAIVVTGIRKEDEAPSAHSFRGLAIVVGAVCLFAFLLDWLGLVLTVFIVSSLSSLASPESSLKRALATGLALTMLCYGVFIAGLEVSISVWPRL